MFDDVFRGRSVWLSGHTGFKGGWLAEWLLNLGASVYGYALAPNTQPALFEQLGIAGRLQHELNDVRDAAAVAQSIQKTQPDFVFHLAAQPLVRLSYDQPIETYATNVMGTLHVLDALRSLKKPCAAVFITSDKCYENQEWIYGYREGDPLGGYDPYSSSKAAAEIVIGAYRRSFFQNHPVRIASARAGNVIGGGDWAADRIVPDCIRALQNNQPIPVRNKVATRPWQHVLEPLSGYLWLAASLRSHLPSPISNRPRPSLPLSTSVPPTNPTGRLPNSSKKFSSTGPATGRIKLSPGPFTKLACSNFQLIKPTPCSVGNRLGISQPPSNKPFAGTRIHHGNSP